MQKLDIVDRPISEVIEVFQKYLTYSRVHSGDALKSARADYENLSKRKIAVQNIPHAWTDLASEPDSLLIDLISDKVESLCGYRPASEDVEDFLVDLGNRSEGQSAQTKPKPAPLAKTLPISLVSERNVPYKIFGQPKTADDAIGALIDILKTLAAKNSTFLERLSPVVRARTRNHIARTREEVYPNRPDLIENTVQLVPGWYLGTNISNRDKMRIIEKACQVEKLVLGKDISITLPNVN